MSASGPSRSAKAQPQRSELRPLAPGTRLEEYAIERVLGGGGFGITYLAQDTHLDLPVALKEYFPSDLMVRGPGGEALPGGSDPQSLQSVEQGLARFIEEARALAAFRHPHIVRVLRYFRAQGTAYIVMAYEPGQPLMHWLPPAGELTLPGLLTIVLPLLEGLEAVHAAGFLHRDIKPDNIYVRTDGTPVLLDFGAARRHRGGAEATPIVSPGFAPLEQYDAHGAQGPWTDLYALGAVMYWMVTRRQPVDAAGRTPQDTLPAASREGDAAVFGLPLLQAIDWALEPDPRRRPRSVLELRAAVRGDDAALAVFATRPGAAAPSPARFPAQGQRNLLCTILFIDLVGYSARSLDDQAGIKGQLNASINRALHGIAANSRLALDTGDGAALCFLGDPEEALQAALLLRDVLIQRYGASLPVRMGLHMGPVRVVSDINDRINVVGDGINVAQRIMDLAPPNQVWVSRAYFDVISRIANGTARLFRHEGLHADKHGRLHEAYSVQEASRSLGRGRNSQGRSLREPAARYATSHAADHSTAHSKTQPVVAGPSAADRSGSRDLPAPLVAALAQALMQHLGPVARLLVTQGLAAGDASLERLVDRLAAHIEHPVTREAFRQEAQRLVAERRDAISDAKGDDPLSRPAGPPRR